MMLSMKLLFSSFAAAMMISSHAVLADPAVVGVGVGGPQIQVWFEDVIYTTLVPPAQGGLLGGGIEGNDDYFAFCPFLSVQTSVAGTAPGQPDWNGGQWAFHCVTYNDCIPTGPFDCEAPAEFEEITNLEKLFQAESDGLVTITRLPDYDFLCPFTPIGVGQPPEGPDSYEPFDAP